MADAARSPHLRHLRPRRPRPGRQHLGFGVDRHGPPPASRPAVEATGTGPIYYYEGAGVQADQPLEDAQRPRRRQAGGLVSGRQTPQRCCRGSWAAPMRAILHWWLGASGILQVHGGAVGTRRRRRAHRRPGRLREIDDVARLPDGRAPLRRRRLRRDREPARSPASTASTARASSRPTRLAALPRSGRRRRQPRARGRGEGDHLRRPACPGRTIAGFPLRAILVPASLPERRDTRSCRRHGGRASRRSHRARSSSSTRRKRTRWQRWPRSFAASRAYPPSSGPRSGADPGRDRRARSGGHDVSGPLVSVVIPVYNGEAFLARGARQRLRAGLRAVRGDRRRRRVDRRRARRSSARTRRCATSSRRTADRRGAERRHRGRAGRVRRLLRRRRRGPPEQAAPSRSVTCSSTRTSTRARLAQQAWIDAAADGLYA